MVLGRRDSAISIILICLLGLATAISLYEGDLLWSALGAWGIIVSLAPVAVTGNSRTLPRPFFLLLLILPVLIEASGLVLRIQHDEILDATQLFLGVLAGFLLSLGSMLLLRAYFNVKMNRPFFVASVVTLFIAALGIYLTFQYLADTYLGTGVLVDNDQLMVLLTMLTFGGLVMGVLLSSFLHTATLDELQAMTLGVKGS